MNRSLCWLILAATGLLGLSGARADIPAEMAERILQTNQQSIVTVRGTIKMSVRVNGMAPQEQGEVPFECPAAVVSTSGWVVASSLQLDPVGSLMKGPIRVEQQGQTMEIQVTSRLGALRLLLPDKTEVPAREVMRDDDLRLTLLAVDPGPGDKLAPLHALPLEQGVIPDLFSSYVVLGRMGVPFQRVSALSSGTVCGILSKPRAAYLPQSKAALPFLGLPFFAAAGKLIGIGSVKLRTAEGAQTPQSIQQNMNVLPVIVPTADINDFIARAKAAQHGGAPKPAAPIGCAALLCLPLCGLSARAEIPVEQARALAQAHQEAVLLVQGTIKALDAKTERKISVAGTVVDASGLVVISSAITAADWKRTESTFTYVLPDGTEVPARLVLSDDDLALAVLAPSPRSGEPLPAFHAVPLARDTQAAIYADVLTLGRLDKQHHFRPAADVGRVVAVTANPRTMYLVDTNPGGVYRHGLPTFLANGRLLGINTLQRAGAASRPGQPGAAAQPGEFQERLIPAAALLDLLDQARSAAGKAATPA